MGLIFYPKGKGSAVTCYGQYSVKTMMIPFICVHYGLSNYITGLHALMNKVKSEFQCIQNDKFYDSEATRMLKCMKNEDKTKFKTSGNAFYFYLIF